MLKFLTLPKREIVSTDKETREEIETLNNKITVLEYRIRKQRLEKMEMIAKMRAIRNLIDESLSEFEESL